MLAKAASRGGARRPHAFELALFTASAADQCAAAAVHSTSLSTFRDGRDIGGGTGGVEADAPSAATSPTPLPPLKPLVEHQQLFEKHAAL